MEAVNVTRAGEIVESDDPRMQCLNLVAGNRAEHFSPQSGPNTGFRQPFRVTKTAPRSEHRGGVNHGERVGRVLNSIAHRALALVVLQHVVPQLVQKDFFQHEPPERGVWPMDKSCADIC